MKTLHHAVASRAAAAIACLVLATSAGAQSAAPTAKPAKPAAKAAQTRVPLLVEQRAIDIIKAASARLAAAKTMSFTAIVDIEYPSKLGPPLAYPVRYDQAMARPDKPRVPQGGAGPANGSCCLRLRAGAGLAHAGRGRDRSARDTGRPGAAGHVLGLR